MSGKQTLFQCYVSKSDFNSLRTYFMYRRKPLRTRIIVYLCLVSVALLAVSEAISGMLYLRPPGLVGMLVVAGIYAWITIDTRNLDKNMKGFLNKKQEMNLSADGVTVKWTGFELAEYAWSDIDHAVETDSHFYLFIDPEFAVIMPKLEMKEHIIKEIHDKFESHTNMISDMSGWKARKI